MLKFDIFIITSLLQEHNYNVIFAFIYIINLFVYINLH